MESIIKDLGINKPGTYSKDNTYVIDLEDSEEFGKIYSTLDSNDELDYLDDSSLLTIHNSNIIYNYNDEIQINLIADFDHDSYRVVVQEI